MIFYFNIKIIKQMHFVHLLLQYNLQHYNVYIFIIFCKKINEKKVHYKTLIILLFFSYFQYESLDLYFSEYRNIMDKYKEENDKKFWENDCEKISESIVKNFKTDVKNNICPRIMSYLYSIYSDSNNPLQNLGCKYLYYWLYKNHIKGTNESNSIKILYEELIKVYDNISFVFRLTDEYKNNIFDEELNIFTDICDLNTMINDIYNSTFESCKNKQKCNCAQKCYDKYMSLNIQCVSRGYPLYCKALESVKKLYNSIPNLIYDCDNSNYIMLPASEIQKQRLNSSRTNISGKLIIPTILIFLIPMLFFLIYKVNFDFTPYDFCIHRGIRNIIYKFRGIYKECNILHLTKIYESTLRNSRYNILYDSFMHYD
ncbi:variable surface protein [Plasmodium gonderi]|uniref:Variable surface protein n=1 Tax=Plasmodium gonderi TaxID=77519 RepID=A0A1Y1JBZ4_PLAGO|nr:variable surface protein [Plasmodium gonderi]GAW79198.1 variable surface protein [Plasmodium gonderi]